MPETSMAEEMDMVRRSGPEPPRRLWRTMTMRQERRRAAQPRRRMVRAKLGMWSERVPSGLVRVSGRRKTGSGGLGRRARRRSDSTPVTKLARAAKTKSPAIMEVESQMVREEEVVPLLP
jgi:hypothetical protein